jgi:hypothetical protein
MPHLSVILDHTVWLAETIPSAMRYVLLSTLSWSDDIDQPTSNFLNSIPSSLKCTPPPSFQSNTQLVFSDYHSLNSPPSLILRDKQYLLRLLIPLRARKGRKEREELKMGWLGDWKVVIGSILLKRRLMLLLNHSNVRYQSSLPV